jgi:predicted nucleic acid-binding protein/plasmid stability protein
MVNLSVKNVPDELAELLRQRAARNRRSLQRELLSILEAAAGRPVAANASGVAPRAALTIDELAEISRRLFPSGTESSVGYLRHDRPIRLRIAEPRAAYLHRPALVTDASVIAAALFGEEGQAEALALLHGRTLHAPHLLDHEIAGIALKKLRREGLALETIGAALQAYARLPIERHAVDVAAVVVIAERRSLTAYDAAYLHVAEQLTAPLATLDDRLAAAARSHLAAADQVHQGA